VRFDAAISDPDGGFVLAGHTDSFGAGMNDLALLKLDASGTFQWMKTYGGPKNDIATALTRDSDGGLLLAGYTESYGAGANSAWLVKTDPAGTPQWQRSYGGTQYDYAYSVFPWGSGYLMAGLTYSFGSGGDLWVLSLDSTGIPLWQKSFGSTGYDGLTSGSAMPTPDGGFAVACSTEGFGAQGSDVWVLKFTSAGAIQWQKRYGGSDLDDAFALVAKPDGGLLVGGTTFTYDLGQGDFWLLNLDGSGTILWQKSYGGNSEDQCWALAQSQDGGTFAAGFTMSYGAGGADFMLLKVDEQGQVDGACVSGRPSSSAAAATNAAGATTAAASPASTSAAPAATPTSATTTVAGPFCAPTQTCTLTCSASANPTQGAVPLSVKFTGNATATYCAGTPTYFWDFGDGPGTSTEKSPTYVYATSGDYIWLMNATVDGITSNNKTGTVHVCDFTCNATATPASGQAPLAVNFAATFTISPNCTGNPQYTWDFGDGTLGSGVTASHIYAAQGTYTWTCMVNVGGAFCTKTGTITATEPCTVACNAEATPSSGSAPLAVNFTSTVTPSNCAGTPAFAWTFGDPASGASNTSPLPNPTHTYSVVGNYDWTLTVSLNGAVCSKSGTVTAGEPCTLTCDAMVPVSGRAGDSLAFTATAEASHCAGAPTFAWTFGDGATSGVSNPSHTYAAAGAFDWTLTVAVEDQVCTEAGTIQVSESCAVACDAAADPASGTAPLAVAFNGSASPSNCLGSPAFAWIFGDGASSSEQNPSHTYLAGGSFTWTFTVTVEGKSCSKQGTIVVVEPCTVACEASAAPDHGSAPFAVAFTATASPSHCIGSPQFAWDFGDGGSSLEQNPSHTYPAAGTYAWALTVTADGVTCPKTGSITVQPGIPGDCDGNGEVSIGEVQKAINMFLELLEPGCGVDCNANGAVSIGEVQKVINGFLGLAVGC
jgi:PKD repeat protein